LKKKRGVSQQLEKLVIPKTNPPKLLTTYLTFNLSPSMVPMWPSIHVSLMEKYEPSVLLPWNPNVAELWDAMNGWGTLKTK